MIRPPCPCYGCKKRTEICHNTCGKFKKWKKEDAAYKRAIKKAKESDYTLAGLRNGRRI